MTMRALDAAIGVEAPDVSHKNLAVGIRVDYAPLVRILARCAGPGRERHFSVVVGGWFSPGSAILPLLRFHPTPISGSTGLVIGTRRIGWVPTGDSFGWPLTTSD